MLLKGNQGHRRACAYKYCHDNTTRWHCGDILSKVLKRNRFIFLFSHPLLYSPLNSTPIHGLSAALTHLSPSRTCRLVDRMIGCPRAQALIGVEVHRVDLLPIYLL